MIYLTHLTELNQSMKCKEIPIPTLLNNLEIPHQQSTGSKHNNTKLQPNGRPTPRLAMSITTQRRLPRKRVLCPSREPRNPTSTTYKRDYFHSTTFSLRSHFARPWVHRHFPSAVLSGVGTRTRTSVAHNFGEKLAFMAISYETFVRECSVMIGWTRKGKWIFEVARYLRQLNSLGRTS